MGMVLSVPGNLFFRMLIVKIDSSYIDGKLLICANPLGNMLETSLA